MGYVILICIVGIPVMIYYVGKQGIEEKIRQAEYDYLKALKVLKNDPNNSELRYDALQKGRITILIYIFLEIQCEMEIQCEKNLILSALSKESIDVREEAAIQKDINDAAPTHPGNLDNVQEAGKPDPSAIILLPVRGAPHRLIEPKLEPSAKEALVTKEQMIGSGSVFSLIKKSEWGFVCVRRFLNHHRPPKVFRNILAIIGLFIPIIILMAASIMVPGVSLLILLAVLAYHAWLFRRSKNIKSRISILDKTGSLKSYIQNNNRGIQKEILNPKGVLINNNSFNIFAIILVFLTFSFTHVLRFQAENKLHSIIRMVDIEENYEIRWGDSEYTEGQLLIDGAFRNNSQWPAEKVKLMAEVKKNDKVLDSSTCFVGVTTPVSPNSEENFSVLLRWSEATEEINYVVYPVEIEGVEISSSKERLGTWVGIFGFRILWDKMRDK